MIKAKNRKPYLYLILSFYFLFANFSPVYASSFMQPKDDTNTKGIDVSHWDGIIDWQQVKDSGIDFAYLEASHGSSDTDSMFATNVKAARTVHLPIGAFHYATPTAPFNQEEPVKQAQFFVSTMKTLGLSDFGDIMPVLDLEEPTTTGILTPDEITQWARIFVNTVKSQTNRQVMIYTGDWFIEQNNDFGGKLSDLPLWDAGWTSYGYTQLPARGGWTNWTSWQYTDQGKVPGISNPVDLDAGPASLEALRGYLTTPVTSNSFVMKIATDKLQYTSAHNAKITTTVKDANGNKLSGVSVRLSIKNPKGTVKTITGKTSQNGTFVYNYYIPSKLRGRYIVTSKASLNHYPTKNASTSFSVIK